MLSICNGPQNPGQVGWLESCVKQVFNETHNKDNKPQNMIVIKKIGVHRVLFRGILKESGRKK